MTMEQINSYLPFAAFGVLLLAYIAAFFYVPTGSKKALAYMGAVLLLSGTTWFVYYMGKATGL